MSELPVDASQDLVGQILGQTYEVKKPLGMGGMGVVYEVANVRLGKRLAVKVLSKLASSDDEVVQRFRREAQIATDLGHPNVIDVIDFNEIPEGVPYMVMELLQGEDLQALLTRTSVMPLERAGPWPKNPGIDTLPSRSSPKKYSERCPISLAPR